MVHPPHEQPSSDFEDPFADLGPQPNDIEDPFADLGPQPEQHPFFSEVRVHHRVQYVPIKRARIVALFLTLLLWVGLWIMCSFYTGNAPASNQPGSAEFIVRFESYEGGPCSVAGEWVVNGESLGLFYLENDDLYPFTAPGRADCLRDHGYDF